MADLTPIDRLRANLRTSSVQQKNQPLFQVIDQLIGFVRDLQQTVNNIALNTAPAYAQLTSSVNQQPVVTTPVQVTFNTPGPAVSGFTFAAGVLTAQVDGVYVASGTMQVGETANGHVNVDGWIRINSTDVPNTNCRDFVAATTDTSIVTINGVFRLNSGDVVKLMFSVDDATKNAGLIASTPAGEPAIPSVMFIIVKVSD